MEILTLKLLSPLYYVRVNRAEKRELFDDQDTGTEKLCCFELDEIEQKNFEPDAEKILGRLIFNGEIAGDGIEEAGKDEELFTLPTGNYLFAQKRQILSREDIINMAIEIQQEGLWQRLKTGKLLYLRYLFEDGSPVTQLYRPIAAIPGNISG